MTEILLVVFIQQTTPLPPHLPPFEMLVPFSEYLWNQRIPTVS